VPGAPAPVRLHETRVGSGERHTLDPDFCVFPDFSREKILGNN
jgi:hypothetical protein